MSNKSTVNPPEILAVPIKELQIDISLSGRSKKEIAANAKALAPALTAAKGWDASQPGAFFVRNGEKHLARGFTRVEAATIAKVATGYFVEIPDEPANLRTEAIRSNRGAPISAFEQGRIYAGMRDGTKDPDKLAVGEVALKSMSQEEIAAEVGYTASHISRCTAIFESPEEIAELIAEDKVAATVVTQAAVMANKAEKGLERDVDEAKQLKIVKAAIKAAGEEGKSCATMKHLNLVKAQFAPKLKADGGDKKKDAPPKAEDVRKPDDDADESGSGEQEEEKAPTPQAESVMELGLTAPPPVSKKSAKDRKEGFRTILTQWGDECTVTFSDEDFENLWERIESSGLPI